MSKALPETKTGNRLSAIMTNPFLVVGSLRVAVVSLCRLNNSSRAATHSCLHSSMLLSTLIPRLIRKYWIPYPLILGRRARGVVLLDVKAGKQPDLNALNRPRSWERQYRRKGIHVRPAVGARRRSCDSLQSGDDCNRIIQDRITEAEKKKQGIVLFKTDDKSPLSREILDTTNPQKFLFPQITHCDSKRNPREHNCRHVTTLLGRTSDERRFAGNQRIRNDFHFLFNMEKKEGETLRAWYEHFFGVASEMNMRSEEGEGIVAAAKECPTSPNLFRKRTLKQKLEREKSGEAVGRGPR
ncbi:hypothetical protein CRG98_032472 [Punica granatum]|uniref:Uncharacterized protein n=1 Tax=Punica granatum TaxID=22663 RepID=A0A2I0IU02_PUNGR|nr:hypothetical protein CRG98_032472 [Punica granatum]